ncbi:hypothetical protein [Streptomyces sp. NPDC047315]|uniref:hypothetical protein n=1 Tax=Streptomyces sp. NPDC047315 TaxID=3155142 RepID=UPI0033C117F6
MELSSTRVLVTGATAALRDAITEEPADRGVHVALIGRDRGRLVHTARAHPGARAGGCDVHGPGSCARAVHSPVVERRTR